MPGPIPFPITLVLGALYVVVFALGRRLEQRFRAAD